MTTQPTEPTVPATWAATEDAFDLEQKIARFVNANGRVVSKVLPQYLFEVSSLKGQAGDVLKFFADTPKATISTITPQAMKRMVRMAPQLMSSTLQEQSLPVSMMESPFLGYFAIESNSKVYGQLVPPLKNNPLLAVFAVIRWQPALASVPKVVFDDPAFHTRMIRICLGVDELIHRGSFLSSSFATQIWSKLTDAQKIASGAMDLLIDAGLLTKPSEIPVAKHTDKALVKRLFDARSFSAFLSPTDPLTNLTIFHFPEIWANVNFVLEMLTEHPHIYVALPDEFKKRPSAMEAVLACRPTTGDQCNALLLALKAFPRPNEFIGVNCNSYEQFVRSGFSCMTTEIENQRQVRFYANSTALYRHLTTTALPYTWLLNDDVLHDVLFTKPVHGINRLVEKCVDYREKPELVAGPSLLEPDILTDNVSSVTRVEWRAFEMLKVSPSKFFDGLQGSSYNLSLEVARFVLAHFSTEAFSAEDADYAALEVAKRLSRSTHKTFGFWGRMNAEALTRRLADVDGFAREALQAQPSLLWTEEVANEALSGAPSLVMHVLRNTGIVERHFEKHLDLPVLLKDESFLDFCFERPACAREALKWMLKQPASSPHGQTARDALFVKKYIIQNEKLDDSVRKELYATIPVDCLTHEIVYNATKEWGVSGDTHETGLFDEIETRLLRIAARSHSTHSQLCDDGAYGAATEDFSWLKGLDYDLRTHFAPSSNWKVPHRLPGGHAAGAILSPPARALVEMVNDLADDAEDAADAGLRQVKKQLEHYARALGEITRIERLRDGGSKQVREFYQMPSHGIRVVWRKTFDPPAEPGDALVERWGLFKPGSKAEIKLPASVVADMPSSYALQLHGVLCCTGYKAAAQQRAFYKKIQQQGAVEEEDILDEPALQLVVQRIGRTAYTMVGTMRNSFDPLTIFLDDRTGRPVWRFVAPVRGERYDAAELKRRKQQASQEEIPDTFVLVATNKHCERLFFEREDNAAVEVAMRVSQFLETGVLGLLETMAETGASMGTAVKIVDDAARAARNPCVYRQNKEKAAKRQRVGPAASVAASSQQSSAYDFYNDSSDDEA